MTWKILLLTHLTIGLHSITQIEDRVRCVNWGWNEIVNNLFPQHAKSQ
jgi:hypothetical protein